MYLDAVSLSSWNVSYGIAVGLCVTAVYIFGTVGTEAACCALQHANRHILQTGATPQIHFNRLGWTQDSPLCVCKRSYSMMALLSAYLSR